MYSLKQHDFNMPYPLWQWRVGGKYKAFGIQFATKNVKNLVSKRFLAETKNISSRRSVCICIILQSLKSALKINAMYSLHFKIPAC